jgi:Transposase IS4
MHTSSIAHPMLYASFLRARKLAYTSIMATAHATEFTTGWQGPSMPFLPMDIPNTAGRASIPAHIDLNDPLALFQLYISDQTIQNWVTWSNGHARMHAHEHEHTHDWHEIDSSEMHGFLAIIIARGLWPVPHYKEYWMRSMHTPHYAFTERFSRRRYEQIWRFFRPYSSLVVEAAQATPTSLCPREYTKMQCISEEIMKASQHYWLHGSDLCIDEEMCKFQGRTMHSVTLKNKPIPHGYKINALCEQGYALLWLFYTPKAPTFGIPYEVITLTHTHKLSNTESIAFALAYMLPKRCPMHVYVDNYFTSTRLAIALREHQIGLTGVCKSSAIIATRVRESEHAKMYDSVISYASHEGQLMHMSFWDQKYICMQSTVFDARACIEVRWRRAQPHDTRAHAHLATGVLFEKRLNRPCASLAYNYGAKQVDHHNQLRAQHVHAGRNLKNWHPILVHLINTAMTNAFLLAQRTRASYKGLREFKIKLYEQLMERANPRRKRPMDTNMHEALCTSSMHTSMHTSKSMLKKAPKQAPCIVCRAKGQDAKRRKPLGERSSNCNTSHFRVARSSWCCIMCSKTLCNSQQCIDAHLQK